MQTPGESAISRLLKQTHCASHVESTHLHTPHACISDSTTRSHLTGNPRARTSQHLQPSSQPPAQRTPPLPSDPKNLSGQSKANPHVSDGCHARKGSPENVTATHGTATARTRHTPLEQRKQQQEQRTGKGKKEQWVISDERLTSSAPLVVFVD